MEDLPFDDIHETHADNDSFRVDSGLGDQVRYETIDMLRSGWSPGRITRHLHQVHGIEVPLRDIIELRDTLPPAALLPPGHLQKRYLMVDLAVDALGELGRLIKLQEERLNTALKEESESKQHFDYTDEVAKQYEKQLVRYLQLQMDLGLLPTEPMALQLGLTVHKAPTTEDILQQYGGHREGPPADSGAPEG
jgi:hypothetical protein